MLANYVFRLNWEKKKKARLKLKSVCLTSLDPLTKFMTSSSLWAQMNLFFNVYGICVAGSRVCLWTVNCEKLLGPFINWPKIFLMMWRLPTLVSSVSGNVATGNWQTTEAQKRPLALNPPKNNRVHPRSVAENKTNIKNNKLFITLINQREIILTGNFKVNLIKLKFKLPFLLLFMKRPGNR